MIKAGQDRGGKTRVAVEGLAGVEGEGRRERGERGEGERGEETGGHSGPTIKTPSNIHGAENGKRPRGIFCPRPSPGTMGANLMRPPA